MLAEANATNANQKTLMAEANATFKRNRTYRNAELANATRLTSCDSVRHSLKFNQIRLNSPQQSVAIPSE